MNLSYRYSFDIVSMLMLIFIYTILKGKQKANILMYKVYYGLLVATFCASAINIIMTEFFYNSYIISYRITDVLEAVYYLLLISIMLLYTMYILCMAGIDYNVDNLWKVLIIAPVGITIIGELHMIISPQLFQIMYWDAKVILSIVFSLYYICLWGLILIKYRKILSTTKKTYVRVFGVVHLFVLLLFFLTEMKELFTFEVSVLLLVNLYAIQSPEDYFDKSDAMLLKHFINSVKLDILRDRDFSILFIRFHDIDVKYDSFGDINTNMLLSKVVAVLQETHKSSIVYRIDKRTFALKIAKLDDSQKNEIVLAVTDRLKKVFRYGDISTIFAISTILVDSYKDFINDNYEENSKEVVVGNAIDELISFVRNIKIPIGKDLVYKELLSTDKESIIIDCVKRAVENNGFMVYYQPIYSTNKKRIVAAEALIRLIDKEHGFISPEDFIPLAEREGYILKIGEFVFTEVCRFYSENNLKDKGIDYIEVNLSAVQCMQYKLADEFVEIMHKYGLNSSQINFEITETSAMNKNSAVELNINYFVDHGVDLSLDDYGTGYSNISYLYNLPFAFMKIDKSILWSSDKNDKANITLNNIFKMAKNLKMRTVVEGVETEEHIKKLLKLDCDYFQGYYFSKPVNENDFVKYLDEFTVPDVCMV